MGIIPLAKKSEVHTKNIYNNKRLQVNSSKLVITQNKQNCAIRVEAKMLTL